MTLHTRRHALAAYSNNDETSKSHSLENRPPPSPRGEKKDPEERENSPARSTVITTARRRERERDRQSSGRLHPRFFQRPLLIREKRSLQISSRAARARRFNQDIKASPAACKELEREREGDTWVIARADALANCRSHSLSFVRSCGEGADGWMSQVRGGGGSAHRFSILRLGYSRILFGILVKGARHLFSEIKEA